MTGALVAGWNPLAQAWMHDTAIPADTPRGFRDLPGAYVYTLSPTRTTPVLGQQLELDGDAPFLWRELRFRDDFAFSGYGAVRLRFPDGELMSSDFLALRDIVGAVYPEKMLEAGGFLQADSLIVDPGGAGTMTIHLILIGRKRYRTL